MVSPNSPLSTGPRHSGLAGLAAAGGVVSLSAGLLAAGGAASPLGGFAPGGAGSQITLALESLNASGYPLRNKGAGFPLVSALDSSTRQTIGAELRAGCDVTGGGLTAYRLSTNELSSLFNVYVSKPFALTSEG